MRPIHQRIMRCAMCAVFTISAVAVPAAAQKNDGPIKAAPSKKAPRGKVLEWRSAAGKPYLYRIPEKLSASSPPNLIFMFHGTGCSHYWAFANYPIAAGRFRGRDIVVSPEGMTPGQGKTFNFTFTPDDSKQIVDLIKGFKRAFPIARVFLYGHSQGAFFCYWFAGEHPALVDGFVAHAGNVLNVKHPKLAKRKLAVGILHGRADQVVSVACATRSAKVYRDLGYEKVKLEIVEGLAPRAGHWPLPQHVATMFEWVELVSRDAPEDLIAGAEAGLRKDAPDVALVADAVARAGDRLAKRKRDDPVRARHRTLATFLDTLAAAHAAAILEDRKSQGAKGIQPWMVHFRRATRALGAVPGWAKAARSLAGKAKAHGKKVAKARSALESKWNAKAAARAIAVVKKYPLGEGVDELRRAVVRYLEKGEKPVKAKTRADFEATAAAHEEATKTADERRRAIDAAELARLRASDPERFAAPAASKNAQPAR